MSFIGRLEKILTKFGKNTSPIAVVVGIAIAKGIFRPMFTMMDKNESYETKRYTAIREGLTEIIAIPVYWGSGVVTKAIAKKLAQPKYFMKKNLFELYKNGKITPEVDKAYKSADKLAKYNLPRITTSLSFVGVCAAALFFIPFICSAAIKPILENFGNKKTQTNSDEKTNIAVNRPQPTVGVNYAYNKVFSGFNNASYGMKVGGV